MFLPRYFGPIAQASSPVRRGTCAKSGCSCCNLALLSRLTFCSTVCRCRKRTQPDVDVILEYRSPDQTPREVPRILGRQKPQAFCRLLHSTKFFTATVPLAGLSLQTVGTPV